VAPPSGLVARIGGKDVVDPSRGRTEVRDPANQGLLTTIGDATPDEVVRAAEIAHTAWPQWRNTSAEKRAAALRGIAAEVRGQSDALAALITAETGKLLPEAEAEIRLAARYLDWFASIVPTGDGRVGSARVTRHPVGVVAAITTWNFPLSIPMRKIAAAVAAGCPVVLKPSPLAPLTAQALVRLCEGHLPTGTIGMVLGGVQQGRTLAETPLVRAVTFTGSTDGGVDLAMRLAADLTRSVLELGGQAPAIVMPDAHVTLAVDTLMQAKFRNNGASCIAANNVFVHESVLAPLMTALVERVRALRPGDPRDPASTLGPMRTPGLARTVEQLVEAAERDGCYVMRGPRAEAESPCFTPAVLVHVDHDTASWDREVYGPLLQVRGYRDPAAVVDEVNGWRRGLGGYVIGGDAEAATELAQQLRVGIVGIGTGSPNTPEVPFGGFDMAGWGREGAAAGLEPFLEHQSIAYGM